MLTKNVKQFSRLVRHVKYRINWFDFLGSENAVALFEKNQAQDFALKDLVCAMKTLEKHVNDQDRLEYFLFKKFCARYV